MNRLGILHLPLALLTLALCGAGWVLLQRVRARTEAARHQRVADLSLGREILALKAAIEETQTLNERIRALRDSFNDEATERGLLNEELSTLRLEQIQKVETWEGFRKSSMAALPPLPWRKTPDDRWGPTPWIWNHSPEEGFQIRIEIEDAKATGILESLSDDEAPRGWKARWTSPT